MDLFEIARSWYRAGVHTPEQRALADTRLHVCNDCDQKTQGIIPNFFLCKACGCPLAAKVYSTRGGAECPFGKWEQ